MAKKNQPMQFGTFMNNLDENREDFNRHSENKTVETKAEETVVNETEVLPVKKTSTANKKNGKTVYFDDDTQAKFRTIKYLQDIDATSIIYTAVVEFMDKYYEENGLSEKGKDLVEEIYKNK